MTKVIVAGAAGRMGRRICDMVQQHSGLTLSAAFEQADSPFAGKDVGETAGFSPNGVTIADSLEAVIGQGEVIIDFTSPKATMDFIKVAAQHGRAMVIGTTGLTAENLAEVRETAAACFPCVQAPNMAVGVNVLFKLTEKTAAVLGDAYDVEIVEAHHRMKKDAPSGTALKLGEMAAAGLGLSLIHI